MHLVSEIINKYAEEVEISEEEFQDAKSKLPDNEYPDNFKIVYPSKEDLQIIISEEVVRATRKIESEVFSIKNCVIFFTVLTAINIIATLVELLK